ncbi:unnamed protein product [Phytophthora fragariaefolia]|uniref:Unnamed protein product n=1 Tax=Phytophthora fragariaefolia TaxID=1490495 RepID=A0A9W7D3Z4_9STRA|nr:unnamed protein product [Phytophthora fragariaefolia]
MKFFKLPYCTDSGSDYTVIGQSHWEQLRTRDPSVETITLDTPILNQTFGWRWVSANKKTNLHVMIHTAARPVEPMGAVEVLIVGVDDDEFIIGIDLLTLLGIDVNRQLEQLAARDDGERSGDPIVLEADEPPVTTSSTDPSATDIFAAVERD